uniref:CC domain-containing protein n=1 Tax=Strongyloides venezuelensis TaxID=75913 RepID=A0A0K0EX78_STRVS
MKYNLILQKLFVLFLLLITYSSIFLSAAEDYRYHCPAGHAKKDQKNDYVQCLPGDYSTHTCGDNHFCFFSGFNYVCCPEGKNSKKKTISLKNFECPENSFIQLNENSQLINCKRNTDCNGLYSQCHNGYCCSGTQKIKPTNYPVTSKKKEKKVIEIDLNILDCPHPFLTVLNDESLPTICDKLKPCSNPSEECLLVGKVSICCENLGSAGDEDDDSEETNPNIIKIYESSNEEKIEMPKDRENNTNLLNIAVSTNKKVETTALPIIKNKPLIDKTEKLNEDEEKTVTIIETITSVPKKIKLVSNTVTAQIKSIINDESVKRNNKKEMVSLPIVRSKIHSSGPTKTTYDAIKLEPHYMGGYQKVRQEDTNNNKRAIIQKFLMDQIKKGWPYEDQFYWPEGYGDEKLLKR